MWGALFAMLAALGFALWNVFLQRGLAAGASPWLSLFTLGGTMAGIFLPLAAAKWWLDGFPAYNFAGVTWFALAGAMTAGIAPLHSAMATRLIGAAKTTTIRLLDPLFAFVIGLVFLAEEIAVTALAGVAMIMLALWLLQSDRSGEGVQDGGRSGLLWAVGASLFFTVGSVLRKMGLNSLPEPVLATAMEGLVGLLIALPSFAFGRGWQEMRSAFSPKFRDLWISGACASFAAFCLVLALGLLPVPAAVALRNTSPWFALFLVPVFLGSRHRPSRWMWGSTLLLTVGMVLILWR